MARFFINLLGAAAIGTISTFLYLNLIDVEKRYDIFDLLKRRPLTAVIGTESPLVAQGETSPLPRAVPLDLNNAGILADVNSALADLTEAVVPSVVSIDTTTNVNVTRVVPTDPFGFFGYQSHL